MLEEGRKRGIHVILQVTPTTTSDRLKLITDTASGFLYIVNVEGVTGTRDVINKSTIKLIKRVKKHTNIPLMAGFGISSEEQATALMNAGVDGVIAGSIFAKIYERNLRGPEDTLEDVARIAMQIKKGMC